MNACRDIMIAPGVRLIHGNAMEILPNLGVVDAIITDPPYAQTSLDWDRWVDGWPNAVKPMLSSAGSMWVFGTLRMFMERRGDFDGWKFAQDIVWEKHNGSSFHADRFRRVHEQAAQFYLGDWASVWKGKVVTLDAKRRTVTRQKGRPAHMGIIEGATYSSEDGGPRLMRSVIYARSMHGSAVHPTQKPEEIIEPLILNACPPGGIVLDPFAGSGTTGVVAHRLGRRAILIEARRDYFEVMVDRFRGDLLSAGGAQA